MKKSRFLGFLFLTVTLAGPFVSSAQKFSGFVSSEMRVFPGAVLYNGQMKNNFSLAFQPEFYYQWENGHIFTISPFYRIDKNDPKRSHFDIREMNFLWLGSSWELRVGIGKVFWGATEFIHIVDIINQTDFVENIDGEDKLGQPMVHLSIPRAWGVIDIFVMPFFRERTFPGDKGRFRLPVNIKSKQTKYQSSAKKFHPDFALRYSHTLGLLDFGISFFKGTGREPILLGNLDENNKPGLIPFYGQINQTSLDMQYLAGKWLFKLEGFQQTGQGESFAAMVFGLEYSFLNFAGTNMDLDIITEFAYDSRGKKATTAYQNDAVVGLRLAMNDPNDSQLLAATVWDVTGSSSAIRFEANRRFGSNLRMSLTTWMFNSSIKGDFFYSLRHDDIFQFELTYYY